MSEESSKRRPHVSQSIGVKKPNKMWGIPGALFFGAAAFLLPELIFYSISANVALLPLTDNTLNFLYIALYDLVVLGIIGLVLYGYGSTWRDLGLNDFKAQFIGKVFLAFVIYFPLSILLSYVVSLFVAYDQEQEQALGFAAPIGVEPLLIFVGLVLLTPFVEEILFRGFIFKGIRKRLSFFWTTLIVSILFAVAHGQVNVGLDTFALSIALCYLREKTDSLWPSILLHMLKNGIAFAFLAASGFSG